MANEITVNGSLSIQDATSPTDALQSRDTYSSPANFNRVRLKQLIAITPTAILVTGLVSPGWAMFFNRDDTNRIDLYTDDTEDRKMFASIPPGMSCGPFFLGDDAAAPYAQADVEACEMEYFILDS